MKQRSIEWSVYLTLVVAGTVVRYAYRDVPNFAPVAAIALFSGYFFRRASVAISVPLLIMGISDLFIGGYDWKMMSLVYGSLAFPVALRGLMRHWFACDGSRPIGLAASTAGLLGCSMASSALFYLVTNFGCWIWSDMYDPTWQGLLRCYASALPFFRYTLTGDLFFGLALFGSFAAAMFVASSRVASPGLDGELRPARLD